MPGKLIEPAMQAADAAFLEMWYATHGGMRLSLEAAIEAYISHPAVREAVSGTGARMGLASVDEILTAIGAGQER